MTIPKRQLGSGGPMVSAIGFGCMSFAGFFGPTNEDESLECLAAVEAAGIDFWDTSNIYGMGLSETVIGKYLAQSGAKITLATKGGIVVAPERTVRNDEDHLRDELEKSLKRLGRDKVELYYVHRRQASIPVETVVETLVKFIEEGLIDSYGLSEVAPSTLRRAHAVHPCRAVQNEYSLWTRQPELGLIQTCQELGTAFVPFSPLARGMLGTTPPNPAEMRDTDWRKVSPRFMEPNYSANRKAVDAFAAFAAKRGVSPPAMALAWILDTDPNSIPIPATRSAAHLAEWATAWDIKLTDEDRAEIARLLPVGFAHGDRYSDAQMQSVERYC